jgi:riboflavin biosynthesis pyrimidine reductase
MRTLIKCSLLTASVAVIGTSSAIADDPQLQTRLALQRQEAQRSKQAPAIAVYARERGVGKVQTAQPRQKRYVWKTLQVGNSPIITYLAAASTRR